MKKNKDKSVVAAVLFVLSALTIITIAVHGCGISSYEGKKVTSLSIEPVNNTAAGGTVAIAAQTVQQFKAMGHYSDATMADMSSSSTWTTSDQSVATVSASGLAAAVASSGTCTISATSEGMTASVQLTVKNLTIQSITVTPASVTTNKGFTKQFTASGLFSSGTETIPSQDITSLATWSSSNASVATINDPQHPGLATTVNAGTTDITAQWSGVTSAPATLSVSNVALQSIDITAGGMVRVGDPPVQFTATGTFVDNSTQDMTSDVAWESLDPSIATVDGSGLVTAVSPGRATVTATAGGITASLQVTVYAPAGH